MSNDQLAVNLPDPDGGEPCFRDSEPAGSRLPFLREEVLAGGRERGVDGSWIHRHTGVNASSELLQPPGQKHEGSIRRARLEEAVQTTRHAAEYVDQGGGSGGRNRPNGQV